jgi:hypothetical protein
LLRIENLGSLLTGLIVAESAKLFSQSTGVPAVHGDGVSVITGIWFSFFLGAAAGAALVLRFGAAEMLAVVLLLCVLLVCTRHSRPVLLDKSAGS